MPDDGQLEVLPKSGVDVRVIGLHLLLVRGEVTLEPPLPDFELPERVLLRHCFY